MAEVEHGTSPAAPAETGLPQLVLGLLRELPGLVSDRLELLALELRRAGRALTEMVVLMIALGLLGVTLWLLLWGVAVALLVLELGWHWAPALLAAAALNAVAAWLALRRVRTLAPLLALPVTQRHLTLRRTPPAPAPAAAASAAQPLAPSGPTAP